MGTAAYRWIFVGGVAVVLAVGGQWATGNSSTDRETTGRGSAGSGGRDARSSAASGRKGADGGAGDGETQTADGHGETSDPARSAGPASSRDAGDRDTTRPDATASQVRPGWEDDASPSETGGGADEVFASVSTRDIATFGDGREGLIRWVSRYGQLVVFQAFVDTNGDGELSYTFSRHGKPSPDTAEPFLYDAVDDEVTEYDEVLVGGPWGRRVALKAGDDIWLHDAKTGKRRNLVDELGVEPESDEENPCFAPRQLALGSEGRLLFPDTEADTGHIHDPETGRSWEIPAPEPELWRFFVDDYGWATMLTVPEDTNDSGELEMPVSRTSCACRWCGQFAMSTSYWGWEGDEVQRYYVAPGKTEPFAVDQNMIPIGAKFITLKGEGVIDAQGNQVELPDDCQRPRGVAIETEPTAETARLVVECGESQVIWSPETGERRPLPAGIELVELNSVIATHVGENGRFLLVEDRRSTSEDGEDQSPPLARLELGGPQFELTDLPFGIEPTSVPAGDVHVAGDGWVLVADGRTLHVLSVADGRHGKYRVETDVEEVDLPVVELADGSRLLVLFGETPSFYRVDSESTVSSRSECVVRPAFVDGDNVEHGPWTIRCPER